MAIEKIESSMLEDNTLTTYTVIPSDWGIYTDATHAIETMDGLNASIAAAKAGGYRKWRLPPDGEYLISVGEESPHTEPVNSIKLLSDMEYDFGRGTINIIPNNFPAYSILSVWKQNNIVVRHVKIIGDKATHDYTNNYPVYPTHEFGYGMQVAESNYVELEYSDISSCTGDSYFIKGVTVPVVNCIRPKVTNCKLHESRRQGISILTALHGEFSNNEIYGIDGIAPQFGIDVEPDQTGALVQYCTFSNNKIYNNTGGDINIFKGSFNVIEKNELSSAGVYAVVIIHGSNNIIRENVCLAGSVISNSNSALAINNEFIGNKLYGGSIQLAGENARVINNKIYDGNLSISGANYFSEANLISASSAIAMTGMVISNYGVSSNDKIYGPFTTNSLSVSGTITQPVVFNDLQIINYYRLFVLANTVIMNNLITNKGTEETYFSLEASFSNSAFVVFKGGHIFNLTTYWLMDSTAKVIFDDVSFIDPLAYVWNKGASDVAYLKCYFKLNAITSNAIYASGTVAIRISGCTIEKAGSSISVIKTDTATANAKILNNNLVNCTMATKVGDVLTTNIIE